MIYDFEISTSESNQFTKAATNLINKNGHLSEKVSKVGLQSLLLFYIVYILLKLGKLFEKVSNVGFDFIPELKRFS